LEGDIEQLEEEEEENWRRWTRRRLDTLQKLARLHPALFFLNFAIATCCSKGTAGISKTSASSAFMTIKIQ
jgi:hypothetical protein